MLNESQIGALKQVIDIRFHDELNSQVRPALVDFSIVSVTKTSIELILQINNTNYVSLDSEKPSNITLRMRPSTFRDPLTKAYFINKINL